LKALIFHARAWDFVGRDGGAVKGNSVSYLEDMPPATDSNEVGLPPMQMEAFDQAFSDVVSSKLPALFDLDVVRRPGRKGKPESVIVGAKFLSSVPVQTLLGAAASSATSK
jgi:hypothetical protein